MYDKDKLAKSTGASLGVVAIVGMLFMSSGMAFAAPIANIGGFQVQADFVGAQDFILYPGLAQTSNSSANSDAQAYPMAVNELTGVRIEGFALVKELDMSTFTGNALNGQAAIVIANSGTVQASSVVLKTPALTANSSEFTGLTIYEEASTNVNTAFSLRANGSVSNAQVNIMNTPRLPGVNFSGSEAGISNAAAGNTYAVGLNGTNIRAAYLVTDSITLNNLGVEVWYSTNDDDFQDAKDVGGPNANLNQPDNQPNP